MRRLQQQYRISQEDLRLEQERSKAAKKQTEDTRVYYEELMASREVQYQQELDGFRQRLPPGNSKGKQRE
jgi:hypothetical protein